jgi:hypothetical protein
MSEKEGIIRRMWARVLTKIGIAAVIMFGLIFLVVYLIEKSGKTIKELSESFETGKIETEFRDYVTEVKGLHRLQVASLKTVDIFTKVDSKSILWNLIDLPDVKVEIKLPVEYTYYLDLNDKWDFQIDDSNSTIKVYAPLIKPGTPAVDISGMNVTVQEGSILRDTDEVKEKLISELTERLQNLSFKKIEWIREAARKETIAFVNNWFVQIYFKGLEAKPKLDSLFFADEVTIIPATDSLRIKNSNL